MEHIYDDDQLEKIEQMRNNDASIEYACLSGAVLSDLDFLKGNTYVYGLAILGGHALDITSLRHNTVLERFIVYGNRILSIDPLENNTVLTTLILHTSAPFNSITNSIPNNTIKVISTLTSLVRLDISHNYITSIRYLSSLVLLTKLDISHNEISDISPLKALTNLRDIHLNHNVIIDVSPLKDIEPLEFLYADNNLIRDMLCLLGCINLVGITTSNNPLPIDHLTRICEHAKYNVGNKPNRDATYHHLLFQKNKMIE